MPQSRSIIARDTVPPKPQMIVSLKYSPDFKIIFSFLHDPQPREPFKGYEPLLSPSCKNTNIYLCAFQRDRMLAAVKTFNWPPSIVTRFSGDNGLELFEVRVTVLRREPSFPRPRKNSINSTTAVCFDVSLNRAGDLEVAGLLYSDEIGVLFPDKTSFFGTNDICMADEVRLIKVHVNEEACLILKKTQHRTTQSIYSTAARSRALNTLHVTSKSEVLRVNRYGEIMDGTFFTPYFFRNGHWVTPSDASGGMRRATRRFALTRGLCKEADILKNELLEGESCRLSCDGRGFFHGTICLSRIAHNLTSDNEEAEVIDLDGEAANPENHGISDAEDDDEDITKVDDGDEDELLEGAAEPLSHWPRLQSLPNYSSSSAKSSQESTPGSSSETEMSLGSVEAEAGYEPDEEVLPKKRSRHYKNARNDKILGLSCSRSDTGEAEHKPAGDPRRKPRGRIVRRRPKRECTKKAIDYRLFGNVQEVEGL